MRTATAAILAAALFAGLPACNADTPSGTSSMIRYQVDEARLRSWWLTREGVVLRSAEDERRAIALPGWIWADAPHCPPDLAIGPKGEVLVTSNVVPMLWRVDPQTLAVTVHSLALDADSDKDVGFAALVYSAEQMAFIAYSDTQRSAWKVDLALKGATKIGTADLRRSPPAQRATHVRVGPCADLGRRLARMALKID